MLDFLDLWIYSCYYVCILGLFFFKLVFCVLSPLLQKLICVLGYIDLSRAQGCLLISPDFLIFVLLNSFDIVFSSEIFISVLYNLPLIPVSTPLFLPILEVHFGCLINYFLFTSLGWAHFPIFSLTKEFHYNSFNILVY